MQFEIDDKSAPDRQTPRRFLFRIRQEAKALQAMGMDHKSIAHALGIAIKDARLLCPDSLESLGKPGSSQSGGLSRRAVNALLRGRHAAIGGKTLSKRARRLAEIAAAYSLNELMQEPGVGPVTAIEVLRWLERSGRAMRAPA